jgi:hypothetical protein
VKYPKKFPHITRIKPANILEKLNSLFKISLFTVLVLIITLNFHTQFFPDNEQYLKLKLQTLKYSKKASPYVKLAVYLNSHGLKNEAHYQFQVAQILFEKEKEARATSLKKVLGEQLSPKRIYQQIQIQER